jgi:hypothetical protein
MEFAGGAAAALATTGGPQPRGPAVLGPDLWEDMGEPAFVEAINAWGSGMHREVLSLRTDLSATQVSVSGAFAQAQEAVRELVAAFRIEVLTMRQTTLYEAQQSLTRLEQVVEEARARFGEQDTRFAAGLGELAQRLQAADTSQTILKAPFGDCSLLLGSWDFQISVLKLLKGDWSLLLGALGL